MTLNRKFGILNHRWDSESFKLERQVNGSSWDTPTGRDFDLPRHSHYSGVISMVFQHSGGRDFDLPRHSHYSGVISMVF